MSEGRSVLCSGEEGNILSREGGGQRQRGKRSKEGEGKNISSSSRQEKEAIRGSPAAKKKEGGERKHLFSSKPRKKKEGGKILIHSSWLTKALKPAREVLFKKEEKEKGNFPNKRPVSAKGGKEGGETLFSVTEKGKVQVDREGKKEPPVKRGKRGTPFSSRRKKKGGSLGNTLTPEGGRSVI